MLGLGEWCSVLEVMYEPSISLFMIMPVSGTTSLLPKRRLIVVMAEIARPEWSIVTRCDVPGLQGCKMRTVRQKIEWEDIRIQALKPRWVIRGHILRPQIRNLPADIIDSLLLQHILFILRHPLDEFRVS